MIRVLETFRSILLWAAAFPVFILVCLAILAVAVVYRGPKLESFIKFGCRMILFCAGIRVRVRGRENFVAGRRYLIMMNHVNLLDPLVFYARFPGMARTLEEEGHFRWPVYGWMIRKIGQIPVNRINPRKAAASLAQAAEFIRSSKDFSFIIFPEGTRTLDGRLGPFKRGGFLLAAESRLEILPIIQIGAYRIMRKGSRLLRPGRVDVHIEPPIAPVGASRADIADWMSGVRDVFLRRLGE